MALDTRHHLLRIIALRAYGSLSFKGERTPLIVSSIRYNLSMDLHDLGYTLKTCFPNKEIVLPVRQLGEGYASVVVESHNGVVFKIAKNHIAQQTYKKEYKLLHFLSNKIKRFDIPYPQYYIESSNKFPYGLIGYKKIEADILNPQTLTSNHLETTAFRVADFLYQIHSMDISSPEIANLSLESVPPPLEELKQTWINLSDWLKFNIDDENYRKLHDLWKEAEHFWEFVNQPATLVHGDMWFENILVDKNSNVVGVIDFGNVAIGDKAIDFTVQNYIGDQFRNEVIKEYVKLGGNLGEHFQQRMAYLLLVREVYGLEYGIMINDIDKDALNKIKRIILKQ